MLRIWGKNANFNLPILNKWPRALLHRLCCLLGWAWVSSTFVEQCLTQSIYLCIMHHSINKCSTFDFLMHHSILYMPPCSNNWDCFNFACAMGLTTHNMTQLGMVIVHQVGHYSYHELSSVQAKISHVQCHCTTDSIATYVTCVTHEESKKLLIHMMSRQITVIH